MPAGIREAYKSPFDRSNPASQFYNLSSYTRSQGNSGGSNGSTSSQSLHNGDFNNQYYLGGLKTNDPNKLPSFQPATQPPQPFHYPSMHPVYNNNTQNDSNSTASLVRNVPPNTQDPTQGAGWAVPSTQPYFSRQPPQQQQYVPPSYASTSFVAPPYAYTVPPSGTVARPAPTAPSHVPSTASIINDDNLCEDLINKVLNNHKCRQKLKKLLADPDMTDLDTTDLNNPNSDSQPMNRLPPFKKPNRTITEGFSSSMLEPTDTMRTIMIYSLGGLLILCILDLFVKLGQILAKNRN